MNLDPGRLKRFAPFALPLMIVVIGWMFMIRPTAAANTRAARDLDLLEQRLAQVRASASQQPPPPPASDPRLAFERVVPARDASYEVFEQVARLARAQGVTGLEIETGNQVVVAGVVGEAAPQATGQVAYPDPRLRLFDVPLAYTPITMSFEAEFSGVGQFLWNLRDLATTVEIRSIDIKPRGFGEAGVRQGFGKAGGANGRVQVSLLLFSYARQGVPAVATVGASR